MFWRKRDMVSHLSELDGADAFEQALEVPIAVLYKHSSLCGVSFGAIREVERFAAAHPRVPTYVIDVIRNRELSDRVEQTLRIRHESPQVILLQGGEPQWSASHSGVTTSALSERVRLLRDT